VWLQKTAFLGKSGILCRCPKHGGKPCFVTLVTKQLQTFLYKLPQILPAINIDRLDYTYARIIVSFDYMNCEKRHH